MGKIIQWFCGYFCALLSGKQINRFMNLCSRNGIKMWAITYDLERSVRVHFRLRDFYHLRPFLRKTKTHLRIVRKKGFPFWCHRHPYFKWFPVLCMGLLIAFLYSRTLIWNINVDGNEAISEVEIIDYLATENIKAGMAGKKIDCSQLELKIREHYENIGWVSVYVDKTCLRVHIKESLYDIYDREEALSQENMRFDYVAEKDAKIISIVTRSGTALVTAGDEVKQGDTLVEGQFAVFDDAGMVKDTPSVKGDALIWAQTEYSFSYELNEMEIVALKIAGLYDENTIYSIGNQKLYQFISFFEENGVIILEKNVMIESKEKGYVFHGYIIGMEEIGIHRPVEEEIVNELE